MMDKFGILHSHLPDEELPNHNIWQFIYPRIKRWGDLTAFVMSNTDDSLTYNSFIEKSLRWGKELKKYFKGSTPPIVSFIMANNIDCFPLILGCYSVGAPICPIGNHLNAELCHIMITETSPDIIVMDTTSYEYLKETIDKTGVNPQIYVRGDDLHGMRDFSAILNSGDKIDVSEAGQYDCSAVAAMLYSSGTTGNPKCIVISHKAIANSVYLMCNKEFSPLKTPDEAERQQTIIGNLPLMHLGGIEYFTLLVPSMGVKVAYLDCENMEDLLHSMKKYKPEIIRVRNSLVEALSYLEDVEPLRSLDTMMFAGCPSNPDAYDRIIKKVGKKLFYMDCYGSTELNIIALMPIKEPRPGMTGKLCANVIAKFIDSDTGELITVPHHTGEMYAKGPGLMEGYLNKPEATKDVVDSDGWYRTGDIGYFDEDYYIRIADRTDDLITVCIDDKKFKVSPSKIERVVLQHPKVKDVGVVGFPDRTTGEEVPKAFVVSKEETDENDIISFVEANAPPEMRIGGGVIFVDDLPKNPMGKLIRKHLRRHAWFH